MSEKTFRPWVVDQHPMFPPSPMDLVPRDHLVHFIRFRNDHREALSELFVQVLSLCRDAGIAKLGHVALDGTKMKANASKHSVMSYRRMKKLEPELAALVKEWLDKARETDEEEDDEYGPDKRGDELPDHIKAKVKKLLRMQESMARLESEAKAEAERLEKEREEKAKKKGRALDGPKPKALDGVPKDKAQSNFTDPESRIMKTSGGIYEQGYNCQAAVDAESQVIVAQCVTNKQNDSDELVPLVDEIKAHTDQYPTELSADANYCSEANLEALEHRRVSAYIATGRQKHGRASPTSNERARQGPRSKAMRAKLRRGGWRSRDRLRKQSVEPVFGQIKEARGFRRFLLRGLAKVAGEWSLLCTAHNLLKLAAAQAPRMA